MGENERGGAAGAETSDIAAVAAPGRDRRMTAGRKRDAVLRLLRGEPLEIVAKAPVWKRISKKPNLPVTSTGGEAAPMPRSGFVQTPFMS